MKTKKAQGEVIVTVLLILVGIIAVGLVSVFIINMVRSNLQGTECFNTAGQLTIASDDYTFFKDSVVHISVERGETDFNLTGINILLESGGSSTTYTIRDGNSVKGINMSSGTTPGVLAIPKPSGKYSYMINLTSDANVPITYYVTHAKVVPLIVVGSKEKACTEGIAESDIPAK